MAHAIIPFRPNVCVLYLGGLNFPVSSLSVSAVHNGHEQINYSKQLKLPQYPVADLRYEQPLENQKLHNLGSGDLRYLDIVFIVVQDVFPSLVVVEGLAGWGGKLGEEDIWLLVMVTHLAIVSDIK
ncbi:hypothetical protein J6590_049309 [Homalodisca vitripennis]|nr:hypothetical protein J6590_049309 [Homalodisca vitripennis]